MDKKIVSIVGGTDNLGSHCTGINAKTRHTVKAVGTP